MGINKVNTIFDCEIINLGENIITAALIKKELFS